MMETLAPLALFSRRYLDVVLSALPWLLLGIAAEVLVPSAHQVRLLRHLHSDRPAVAWFSAVAWSLTVPASRPRLGTLSGPAALHRLVLARPLNPILIAATLVVFTGLVGIPFYYLAYVVAGSLLAGFLGRLLMSSGNATPRRHTDSPAKGVNEGSERSFVSRLLDLTYVHGVDLLSAALLVSVFHVALTSVDVGSRIYLVTALAYLCGGLGSPSPAVAASLAGVLMSVGQPGLVLSYLLGATWGSHVVAREMAGRFGRPTAAIMTVLLALVSILLASPISWSTLELLS